MNRHGGVGSACARHLLLTVTLLAAFVAVVYVASWPQTHPLSREGRIRPRNRRVIDPAEPDLRLAGLPFPSYVPHELALAGIIRTAPSVYYLLSDKNPLESGESRLSERVEAGAIILLETPAGLMTSEQREAFIASAIEESRRRLERVDVDGHTGTIGHGEAPQLRWWQGGRELNIIGLLTDAELLAMAESVHPFP